MAPRIHPEARPRLAGGYRFQWEQAQGCHVLLFPEGMIKLNDSASAVLKYCGDERTVAQIVERLETDFPGADLQADVLEFLEDAHERGWLETE